MPVARTVCLALLAALVCAAPAAADDVLVMGKDGQVEAKNDRFLRDNELKAPRTRAVAGAARKRRRSAR